MPPTSAIRSPRTTMTGFGTIFPDLASNMRAARITTIWSVGAMNLRASGEAEGVLGLAAPPPSPSCACANPLSNTASAKARMVLTHIFPPLTS